MKISFLKMWIFKVQMLRILMLRISMEIRFQIYYHKSSNFNKTKFLHLNPILSLIILMFKMSKIQRMEIQQMTTIQISMTISIKMLMRMKMLMLMEI